MARHVLSDALIGAPLASCHHLMDTRGRPVSFCEYNARLRQADSWDAWPRMDG